MKSEQYFKKHPVYFRYVNKTFQFALDFFLCDRKDFHDAAKRKLGVDLPKLTETESGSCYHSFGYADVIIWLASDRPEIVVHELTHAAFVLLELVRIKVHKDDCEVMAYLMEEFVREFNALIKSVANIGGSRQAPGSHKKGVER